MIKSSSNRSAHPSEFCMPLSSARSGECNMSRGEFLAFQKLVRGNSLHTWRIKSLGKVNWNLFGGLRVILSSNPFVWYIILTMILHPQVGCIFSEISDADLENLMGVMRIASLDGVQVLWTSLLFSLRTFVLHTFFAGRAFFMLQVRCQHMVATSASVLQLVFMGAGKLPNINNVLDSLQEELTVCNLSYYVYKDMCSQVKFSCRCSILRCILQDENVRFINEYDEALSHLIFGGSDIMPVSYTHLTLPTKRIV